MSHLAVDGSMTDHPAATSTEQRRSRSAMVDVSED